MKTLREHGDAATAAVLTGVTALVVWLLELAGVGDVPPAAAATAAGLIVSLGLGVKHRGIKGLARMLWSGNHTDELPPPPPPPPARRRR
jgi:hypothetical protein